MIGAIIGDIAGSRFEFDNYRKKDFEIFSPDSFFTDDTVMTLAVAQSLIEADGNINDLPRLAVANMRAFGRMYPDESYGGSFAQWLAGDIQGPYNSWGNGAPMRVSACGWVSDDFTDCFNAAHAVTEVTHNHPEALKGVDAVTKLICVARAGGEMRKLNRMAMNYYDMNFTCDEIRPTYQFNESSQGTVPQAIKAFLESTSFEDAIRTAVSLGGDSDTLAAITGSIAEAHWGVPDDMREKALAYLTPHLRKVLDRVESKIPIWG